MLNLKLKHEANSNVLCTEYVKIVTVEALNSFQQEYNYLKFCLYKTQRKSFITLQEKRGQQILFIAMPKGV